RMQISPNSVYVIPPGFYLSIADSTLFLYQIPMTRPRPWMTIDRFFRDLAETQDARAIAIILSGTDHDGTLGLRSMKENLGTVMVQEPRSAEFSGMPQSAIATGLVDYIAPAGDLPRLLTGYGEFIGKIPAAKMPTPEANQPALFRIFSLIRSRTGLDFTSYDRTMADRRIHRRMGVHHVTSMEQYIEDLETNPAEIEALARELLTGGSRFFRNPEVWEALKGETLPRILQSREEVREVLAWVVGCFTGEEAYSLAILFEEVREDLDMGREIGIRILATDANPDVIEAARAGRYPSSIEEDVSPERLDSFFIKEDGTYTVRPEIRDLVMFSRHNVLTDPPFLHMDLISCRNLLIYFSHETQKNLMPVFYRALNRDGALVLGITEPLPTGGDELFQAEDALLKIYRRRNR
ncbi:MAG TPA: CheR family methyltransferase, partial [Methanomicrobiales archaeon]|nr:CheR family methyltransferase [Methanomicrobiales archaeon]